MAAQSLAVVPVRVVQPRGADGRDMGGLKAKSVSSGRARILELRRWDKPVAGMSGVEHLQTKCGFAGLRRGRGWQGRPRIHDAAEANGASTVVRVVHESDAVVRVEGVGLCVSARWLG